MAGGRPSSYKKIYCKRMIEFFDREPYEYIFVIDETGRKELIYDQKGRAQQKVTDFPTVGDFATTIGVSSSTMYSWAQRHPEFAEAMARAKDYQERILMYCGSMGLYDFKFVQFVCKNVLHWGDKGISEFICVDLKNAKTPAKKCERILTAALERKIPVAHAQTMISAYSQMVKIDEITDLREEVEKLKKIIEAQ